MIRTTIVAALSMMAAPAMAVDWYEGEYQTCAAEASTVAIVDCVNRLIDEWDGRLNDAYRETMSRLDSARADQLRNAQRAWIAYRDASCLWYRMGDGTIAAIEASACVFALTRDRAVELETFVGQ